MWNFSPSTPLRRLRRNACSAFGIFCNAQDDADAAWDEVTEGAERDQDGQLVKHGGEAQRDRDFDAVRGNAPVRHNPNGSRSATLSDGRNITARGSTVDGRPTLERIPRRGGTGTKIRYIN